MKPIVLKTLFVVLLHLVTCFNQVVIAQEKTSGAVCSQPVVLEMVPSKNNGTAYIISGKVYAGYPLDELRKKLYSCKVPRPLNVVIDSRVPIGQISSAVAPKLQVDAVRYFIRYPAGENLLIEIKVVDIRSVNPQ
jgi:hypothetical protein